MILLLLLYLEGGHNSSVDRLEDLAGCTRPVDIDAFRNLMDPKEDDFLRANLLPRQFHAIQRERASMRHGLYLEYRPQRGGLAACG